MSSADTGVLPMLAAVEPRDERRATIPQDMRTSIEHAYVLSGSTRFAPRPPGPTTKLVAVWLVIAASGLVALTYMSDRTGQERHADKSAGSHQ